jgi:hypothetical protein
MMYQIVAEREDLIIRMKQHSLLFTLAKARIFASGGWSIVVTDTAGEVLYPAQHETADVADALPVTPNAPTIVAPADECDAVRAASQVSAPQRATSI